jgi:aspartyl-tRNA(Asn)/glutamyl-tRNA(Gln) amidotransferase subunit A
LENEIIDSWKDSIKILESLGANISYVSLPNTKYSLSTYYIIATGEATSNLSSLFFFLIFKRI